jgi:hypothetical protein
MNGQRTRRTRLSRRKVAAAVVLPVAGTAFAVTATMTPAGAAIGQNYQWTFTDSSSVNHTCTIQTEREYPYNGDNQLGRGKTTATGDAFCTTSNAYIGARWTDPDGNSDSSFLNTDGVSTERRFAPVGSALTTIHEVDFFNCQANCSFYVERTK